MAYALRHNFLRILSLGSADQRQTIRKTDLAAIILVYALSGSWTVAPRSWRGTASEPGGGFRPIQESRTLHPNGQTARSMLSSAPHLEIGTTFEDQGAYAKPRTTKQVADLAPNEEIQEFLCNENNQDLTHLVGK